MSELLLLFFTPIKVIVFLTFIIALRYLKKDKKVNRYLIAILFTCSFIEILVPLIHYLQLDSTIIQTIGISIHGFLWLCLLFEIMKIKKWKTVVLVMYFAIISCNLLFYEGISHFNYLTFVCGSFIYITIFTLKNIYYLKTENLNVFLSNNFLLLFVPVIFFFGLSFMFAFRDRKITEVEITAGIDLWNFIIYYVNIVYYGLVNLYIYRENESGYLE